MTLTGKANISVQENVSEPVDVRLGWSVSIITLIRLLSRQTMYILVVVITNQPFTLYSFHTINIKSRMIFRTTRTNNTNNFRIQATLPDTSIPVLLLLCS